MENKEIIDKAKKVIEAGGVILFPTDTVWGLGCDAKNEEAIKKLNHLKQRAEGKNYLMMLDDDRKINRYVKEVPDIAWDLIEYAEKPLTIIYPNGMNVAKEILAEDGSIGIRIPKDTWCNDLLKKLRFPLVSTSANISGETTPMSFNEIDKKITEGVDYIVPLQNINLNSKTSTIMKLEVSGEFKIIRA
jgi:L-threonylcarbamoyladenylate synthase